MTFYELASDALTISVNEIGAELSSLRDRAGREMLWQGGSPWKRRAPVLFPIVGKLPGNRLVTDGRTYTMTQHGFARDQAFVVEQEGTSSLAFTLVDNDETREQYPFPFRLHIRFTLVGGTLTVEYQLDNPGEKILHASLGAHPGFRWPLPGAQSRAGHIIEFEHEETAPIRRISRKGLLLPEPVPTPVEHGKLELNDQLFADDAIIFDQLDSRAVHYSARGTATITVAFPDFPYLGIWSKAPGEFVCIEPWYGLTTPKGFTGDFSEKPGQLALEAGQSRTLVQTITVQPAAEL
ncbi:MAG: aldose 1-epimerase family protein [Lacisediminihabitans sp.]